MTKEHEKFNVLEIEIGFASQSRYTIDPELREKAKKELPICVKKLIQAMKEEEEEGKQ